MGRIEEALDREKQNALSGEQVREIVQCVREEYGDELEFLWQDENAIWRNPVNRKWYGALLRVKGERIGLPVEGEVEVLDLRFEKGMAREFVASRKQEGIRLAYHMNKENWIAVVLDYGVPTEEILDLIDRSYQIVATRK